MQRLTLCVSKREEREKERERERDRKRKRTFRILKPKTGFCFISWRKNNKNSLFYGTNRRRLKKKQGVCMFERGREIEREIK